MCSPDDWLVHPGTVGRAIPSDAIWWESPDFARFSYWGDDSATRAAWRGAACTVGDLDGDGFLSLSGRRPDLIISGGANVHPVEVENVLEQVTGGEDDLRAAAAARLAPYKRPKSYFRARDLPHTVTGKLMAEHLGVD